MTGIGAFVLAVISVSVLSSSCVTSNPVVLRRSQRAVNCSLTRGFFRHFPNERCSNVLQKDKNHYYDEILLKLFYNKLNKSQARCGPFDENVCGTPNVLSECNKYKCLEKGLEGLDTYSSLKTCLAMEEEIDDYELLELFTCRVKKMLPPSSDII